jgi:hypothetical protein
MEFLRAEDEARTRDLNLGKVALYQLSYFRLYPPNSPYDVEGGNYEYFIKELSMFPPCLPYPSDGITRASLSGDCKNRNCMLIAKFLSVKMRYLYWGVYWVFEGTFTSGLPL